MAYIVILFGNLLALALAGLSYTLLDVGLLAAVALYFCAGASTLGLLLAQISAMPARDLAGTLDAVS